MKTFCFAGLFVLFLSLSNCAVSQDYDLELASIPLAKGARPQATVVRFDELGDFEVLREGSNNLFCIADEPGDDRFSVECHPKAMMTYLERKQKRALSDNKDELDRLIAEDIRTGTLAFPVGARSMFVSGSINTSTGVPDSVRVWDELAVPFANEEQTGITTEDAGMDLWLMGEDSHRAHIMVGYRTVAWSTVVE